MRRPESHRFRLPALAGGLAAAAGLWAGCGGGSPVPLTAVPDVRGLEIARATTRICDAGLVPRLAITRVLVPLYPAQPAGSSGAAPPPAIRVTRTSPAPGERVQIGSAVSMAVTVPGNVALAARRRCG